MIKKQILRPGEVGEYSESNLPVELKNIQRTMDYRSQDHVVMYVDLITRMPKT